MLCNGGGGIINGIRMDSECVITSECNGLSICDMSTINEFESERRGRGRKRESARGGGRVQ